MRGKSIPRSVLKSGVKLPELSKSKSMSIPCDLNKANFVISSRGPTPQEELDACRPLLSLSDNLFIKKDRRKPSPVTKRQIEVEIRCEEKQVVDGSNKNNGGPDFRERVRQELSAVLKKSPDFNVVSPRQLLMQEQIENRSANRRQESPATRRIVSFSGTVHVEERDSTSEDEEIENDGKHDEADSKRTEKWQGTTAKSQNVAVSQSNSATNKENENVGTVAEGDACQRCGSQVYSMEKLEPGPGQFYHDRCFRCAVCKTKLSLATFCRSLQATNDPRVYCRPHQPRLDKNFSLDSSAMSIAMALKNTKELKPQPHSLQPCGRILRGDAYGMRYF